MNQLFTFVLKLIILASFVSSGHATVSSCFSSRFAGDYTGSNSTCSTTNGVSSPAYCYKLLFTSTSQVIFKGCDDKSVYSFNMCTSAGGPFPVNSTTLGFSGASVFCCANNLCNSSNSHIKQINSTVATLLATALIFSLFSKHALLY